MLVLTFQIGNDRLALDIHRVREVVPRVELQRAANSPAWLAGMFVYRGQPVPVVDLHHLLGAGECPPHLSSRIILVPSSKQGGDRLIGLLAAQVADIWQIDPEEQAALPGLEMAEDSHLGRTVVEKGSIMHLLDLDRLLPAPVRNLLAGP